MSEHENAPAAPPEGDLSVADRRAVAYDLTGPDRPMIECDVERLAALLASLRAALAAALNALTRAPGGQDA